MSDLLGSGPGYCRLCAAGLDASPGHRDEHGVITGPHWVAATTKPVTIAHRNENTDTHVKFHVQGIPHVHDADYEEPG